MDREWIILYPVETAGEGGNLVGENVNDPSCHLARGGNTLTLAKMPWDC